MPDRLFEFASFVLDPAKRLLLRDGVPQTLTPKAFDVLLLLVEQRKRVLSKDEMLSTLWPDTFVEEANLSQHIFLLRKLLNGDSTTPELIATILDGGIASLGMWSNVSKRHHSSRCRRRSTPLVIQACRVRVVRRELWWAGQQPHWLWP